MSEDKHPIHQHIEREHFERMRALVGDRKFKRVLDVGCGEGILSSLFLDCAEEVIAIDKKEENIKKAQELFPQVKYECVDLEKNILTKEADLIIFSDVIYYLSPNTQRRLMANMHYCLTDDGYFLTSRHLGGGDAELDRYSHLFEKVKSEWVGYGDQIQKWHITLWQKKKQNLRSKEEIALEAVKIINSDTTDFVILGTLFWVSETYNEGMIKIGINLLIQEHNKTNLIEMRSLIERCLMFLYWVLKLDVGEEWNNFQVTYHLPHNGPAEPDYRLPIILDWIGEEKKIILDCGVHTGLHTNEIAKKGHVVTGIDLPEIINKFKDRYTFNAIPCDVYTQMDIFENESFDVVVAGEFIEHLNKPDIFIKEAHRILREGGLLILTCPYLDLGWHDPTHCNRVDEGWLEERFQGMFEIEGVDEKSKNERGRLIAKCRKK